MTGFRHSVSHWALLSRSEIGSGRALQDCPVGVTGALDALELLTGLLSVSVTGAAWAGPASTDGYEGAALLVGGDGV